MPLDVFVPAEAADFVPGAAKRIPFGASSGGLTDSSAFTWDDTLKQFSVTGTVTKVSAAGSVWDSLTMPAATLTLTGGVNVTTATGVNLLSLAAPTITSSSATAVTVAASLYVGGPPAAGGSVTLTSPLALWIDSGITRLDGLVGIGGSASPAAGLEVVTPTDTSDGRPASFDNRYLTVGTGGATGGCVSISYRLSSTTGFIGAIKPGTGNETLHIQNTGASAGTLKLGSSGTTISVLGGTGAVQQASGANLTNSVTVGGTTDTISDFTSLTVYSTDAATIRNDIYQLARKLKQVNDALRLYGWLT